MIFGRVILYSIVVGTCVEIKNHISKVNGNHKQIVSTNARLCSKMKKKLSPWRIKRKTISIPHFWDRFERQVRK